MYSNVELNVAWTTTQKITVGAAVIIASGTVIAALLGFFKEDEAGAKSDDSCGVTVGGSGQGNDHNTTVSCNPPPSRDPEPDPSTTAVPPGDGPWPYVTVRTVHNEVDQGLFVVSCPWKHGCGRIGHVFGTRILWGVCKQEGTGFRGGYLKEPDTWLKIKWPSKEPWSPGDPELSSSKKARHTGWVFAHFTEPMEHNGDLPSCKERRPSAN